MNERARPVRSNGRAPWFVLCLAALLLGGAAPGCALRYTVPKDLTKRLPKSSRKSVFQARTVVTIAIDNKASVRRKMSSTRREIERTQERIEEAENKRSRTIATEKGKLESEIEMLEAKIDFLEEKLDYLDQQFDMAEEELLLAKARFELAKAKLVKKHSVAFSGDVEDFEDQVKSLEEDVAAERADLEMHDLEMKAEESEWETVKNQYYSSIGETSRGWWTEQDEGGATSEKKVDTLDKKASTEGAEEEEKPERAMDKVLRKRAGLVLDDFRVAAKLGNTFPFLLGEDEVEMSLLMLGIEIEACYFAHPNFHMVLQFAPTIGQSLRHGYDKDPASGEESDKEEEDERLTLLPLTLGMRYQYNEGIVLPFLGLNVGFLAVKGDRETKDWGMTFYAKVTAGIDFKVNKTWSVVLELGGMYGQVQLNHLRETDIGRPEAKRETFNLVGGIASLGAVARF